MSRKELTAGKFILAFGLDHVTGPFIQIWEDPADEQDCAIVKIDNTGVHIEPGKWSKIPVEVEPVIASIENRFSPERCNLSPIDIDMVLQSFGLPSHLAELYQMLD